MRRNALDKEKFFEGNRQKWCAIFLACCFAVLTVNIIVGTSFNPVPYMQFLLAIGSLFILGASGDSWVKAYSVKSITETQIEEETKKVNIVTEDKSKPNTEIIMKFANEYSNDPSYAPLEWIEKQS